MIPFLRSRSVRFRVRGAGVFILTLLLIEFLDEVFYGTREAALPLIRDELALTYVQIGILLGFPRVVSVLADPFIGVLADIGWRHRLMLLGGIVTVITALLIAFGGSFATLLLAFCIGYPASGAFVGLSQATLMDAEPKRHEQNMARWTLFGSVGMFVSPLLLAAVNSDWRGLFLAIAVLSALATAMLARLPIAEATDPDVTDLTSGFRALGRDLRRFTVLRWLVLLQFSDLTLDVLYGYLALYMIDVAGVDTETALLSVAVWTGVGLLGDALLIPLLERVRGLTYLRFSAALTLVLFPIFLLVPGVLPKLIVLGLLGFFNAGWYSVLAGQLYSALPGRSGAVNALESVAGVVGALLPFAIGAAADAFGLGAAIWLLLLGPLALMIGLPRRAQSETEAVDEESEDGAETY